MVGDRETAVQIFSALKLNCPAYNDINGTNIFNVSSSGITIKTGKNISLSTGTGTQFGTSTSQKLSFWGITPVDQPAGAAQVALDTYGAGANGFDEAAHASELHALVVEIRRVLIEVGIMKGSA